eukprot:g4132.t1
MSPKGEFLAKDFRSCRLNNSEAGHGKFTLLLSNRILELKSATEQEAKEWVAMLGKYITSGQPGEVEDLEPAFSWLPMTAYASMDKNNPAAHADLISRFFGLMAQVHRVPDGSYTVLGKRGCLEVFDIARVGPDNRLQVTRRSDLHTNLRAASTKAREKIQNEVAKIKVLEKEVAGLAAKIRGEESLNEEALAQLGKLLVVQGKHQRRIKELELQKEVEVEVEVDRSITRVEIKSLDMKTSLTEKVYVPLQEACIYVLGGDDGSSQLSSVERYDAEGGAGWELMAPMTLKRTGAAAVVLNGQLHVMGGHDGAVWLSSVEHFDQTRNQWVVMAPMQFRRQHCAAAVLNGQIYVMGGVDGVSYLSSAERFNAIRNRWELIAQMTSKRVGCAAAVLHGHLYVLGGEDNTSYLNSVERYDPLSNRWEKVAPMSCQEEEEEEDEDDDDDDDDDVMLMLLLLLLLIMMMMLCVAGSSLSSSSSSSSSPPSSSSSSSSPSSSSLPSSSSSSPSLSSSSSSSSPSPPSSSSSSSPSLSSSSSSSSS